MDGKNLKQYKVLGFVVSYFFLVMSTCIADNFEVPIQKSETPLNSVFTSNFFYVSDKLIATKTAAGAEYLHQDMLGTNRLTTDSIGNKIGETKTLPFGEEIRNTGNDKFTFTGKEEDTLGIYYFGARYYSADLGRFLSVDPMLKNQDYSYVNNNPMNLIDLNGEDSKNPQNRQNNPSVQFTALYGNTDRSTNRGLPVREANKAYLHQIFSGGYAPRAFDFTKIFGGDGPKIRDDFASFINSNKDELKVELIGKKLTCAGLAFELLKMYAEERGLPITLVTSEGIQTFNNPNDANVPPSIYFLTKNTVPVKENLESGDIMVSKPNSGENHAIVLIEKKENIEINDPLLDPTNRVIQASPFNINRHPTQEP